MAAVVVADGGLHLSCFNVNGLKAAMRRNGIETLQEYLETFTEVPSAIACFQEVKLETRELCKELCQPEGWEAYYHLVSRAAAMRRVFGGYAGVATFCRRGVTQPLDARHGFEWAIRRVIHRVDHRSVSAKETRDLWTILRRVHPPEAGTDVTGRQEDQLRLSQRSSFDLFGLVATAIAADDTSMDTLQRLLRTLEECATKLGAEGRCMITHHGGCIVVNVYVPAVQVDGVGNLARDRLILKAAFHCLLHVCIRELQLYASPEKLPSTVESTAPHGFEIPPRRPAILIAGDFNVQLSPDDASDPENWPWKRAALPFIEQIHGMLDDCHLVDSFRHFFPVATGVYTCWNQVTGAKLTNTGSRIDFILADTSLVSALLGAGIYDARTNGSDHCPISVCVGRGLFRSRTPAGGQPPSACAALLKQSRVRQGTLWETGIRVTPRETKRSRIEAPMVVAEPLCVVLPTAPRSASTEKSVGPIRVVMDGAEEEEGEDLSSVRAVHVYWDSDAQTVGLHPTLAMSQLAIATQATEQWDPDYSSNLFLCLIIKAMAEETPSPRLAPTVRAARDSTPAPREAFVMLHALCALMDTIGVSTCLGIHLPKDAVDAAIAQAEVVPTTAPIPEPLQRLRVVDRPLPSDRGEETRKTEDIRQDAVPQSKPTTALFQRIGILEEELLERVSFLSQKEQLMYLKTALIAPLCRGHKLPCVQRKVKKPGPTLGKAFWSCALPHGRPNDPKARCSTFQWISPGKAPTWLQRGKASADFKEA